MDWEATRASWNNATRNHNAHKGDQAALLRSGHDVLFPEEIDLLGSLTRARLVHLQCNAGQDSLCLARRGAEVTGIDLSDEAVAFARSLSAATGLNASFVCAEVVEWMHATPDRFDVAFASYGATGWLPDLGAWARGVHRVLRPGGQLVYVEFHPVVWSVGPTLCLDGDDYFHDGPILAPVGDYVAAAGAGLGAVKTAATVPNEVEAPSFQHGLAQVLDALLAAGLVLETVREYAYSNGCRLNPALVEEGRRWVWPDGTARIPLMYGLRARRPAA